MTEAGKSFIVKYHNRKMLLTLDLNALVEVITQADGDETTIHILPMARQERAETLGDVGLVNTVRERFWILESGPDESLQRRTDLESQIVATGKK